MVKNPCQEMWIQSLGWEEPLEKEMATHSSMLAWEIPRTGEPGGLQSMGSQGVRHDLVTKMMTTITAPILQVWFQTTATGQILQESGLHEFLGTLVCIKVVFILYCSLLSMQ